MGMVYEITDAFGIDREKISVPLSKEDPGRVSRLPSGELEIVLPLRAPLDQWLITLNEELQKLGFELTD